MSGLSPEVLVLKAEPSPFEVDVRYVDCSVICKYMGCCKRTLQGRWFVRDICGIICVIFTWMLLIYPSLVIGSLIVPASVFSFYSVVNTVIYYSLLVLALTSHSKAMLTNPGSIPLGNATPENIKKLGYTEGQIVYKCPKCSCIKLPRAHHCSICRRCIRKMDHHCPWVNNCVGEDNQKYFVLFTLYIFLVCCQGIQMAAVYLYYCVNSEWKMCSSYSPPAQTIILLFMFFEGLLFGLFTLIMFSSQMWAILFDQTGIEQLKQEDNRRSATKLDNLKDVFGFRVSARWLSPFTPPYRPWQHKQYMV